MKKFTIRPFQNVLRACGAVLALVGPTFAAEVLIPQGDWSLRFAQMPDQRPEWDAKGYLPDYKITWQDKEGPQVRIEDQADGRCRGFVLVGREYRVPQELPKDLRIEFAYQTYCDCNKPDFKRSGMVYFLILTPAQWQVLAEDPKKAEKIRSWSNRDKASFAAQVHRTQDDATEWTPFTTGNMRHALRPLGGQSVVLALVWGAAHYGTIEWGAFRDLRFKVRTEAEMVNEFFESLNFDMPELARVKAAYGAGDIPAAKAALTEHMKSRSRPEPPPILARSDRRWLTAAEEICDHIFRFVGCPPHQVGKEIQWNEDPFDYDQWAIALNRHSHWLTLGRAYSGTKDEKYAREFVAQLTSWIHSMPIRIGRHYIQGVSPECTLSLDAGIRMGQTWFRTYYHFLRSPSFTVDAQVAMLRSFRDHALYLMDPRHFKSGSNWGMMEINGLYHIGVMLPELRDAGTWCATALERLQHELDYQFYPDGAQTELSPGYHGVSVRNGLGVLDLAKRTGQELPPEMLAKLERTFDYYLRIMMPDGRVPALNDSGWGGVRGWLRTGTDYFPDRDDWRYVATAGREGTPPTYTSCKFDYAGWYVMRTGWEADDAYLILDAGPFSTGHQHEDKLHFIVHANGRRVITEPGNYSYDRSAWRRYVLSTRGHNTVLVDGQEQNRRRQRHTYRSDQPLSNRWFSSPDVDYAEGTYADGYGPKQDKTVTHTRRILFIKPRYWIVVDELDPKDDEPHTYEALFHLEAATATVAPETKVVITENATGGNVAIVPLTSDAIEIDIVKGQTEPVVQGWVPTGKHNVLRPIPTVIIKARTAGRGRLAYAIVPFKGTDTKAIPRVTHLETEKGQACLVARIEFADGLTHDLVYGGAGREVYRVRGYETDAELAIVGRESGAEPRMVFSLGGTRAGLHAP